VTRLIIADAHVGHGGADASDMAGLVARAADAGFGELIYLGDAFQYLIGMSKFWTPSVRLVLGHGTWLRRRGVRVVLIEGNRDFFSSMSPISRRTSTEPVASTNSRRSHAGSESCTATA
jgi:UDP-2,3-diacylglucosamine pyrophosphatase LpxH